MEEVLVISPNLDGVCWKVEDVWEFAQVVESGELKKYVVQRGGQWKITKRVEGSEELRLTIGRGGQSSSAQSQQRFKGGRPKETRWRCEVLLHSRCW